MPKPSLSKFTLLCPLARSSENLMRPVKYVFEYIAHAYGRGIWVVISKLMHSCRCTWNWGKSQRYEHTGVFECVCAWV